MPHRKRQSLKGAGHFLQEAEDGEAEREASEAPAQGEQPSDPSAAEDARKLDGQLHEALQYSGEIKKLTFTLPLELSYKLDELQLRLRIATRSNVTKTEIVQAALERTLREFQEEGTASQLLEDLQLGSRPARSAAADSDEG